MAWVEKAPEGGFQSRGVVAKMVVVLGWIVAVLDQPDNLAVQHRRVKCLKKGATKLL
jgi:hypothetical protein